MRAPPRFQDGQSLSFSASSVWDASTRFHLQIRMIPISAVDLYPVARPKPVHVDETVAGPPKAASAARFSERRAGTALRLPRHIELVDLIAREATLPVP
jgi:hypothetical protein